MTLLAVVRSAAEKDLREGYGVAVVAAVMSEGDPGSRQLVRLALRLEAQYVEALQPFIHALVSAALGDES